MDVHLSADKVPVVIHDATLCRTTDAEKGLPVRRMPLEQLKQLDAGAWFHGEETSEQVPMLKEVLELSLDGVGLMIELKDDIQHDLSHSVIELLDRYRPSKVYIGSFFPETLQYFMKNYPNLPLIGILDDMEYIESFQTLGIRHLAVDYTILDMAGAKKGAFDVERLWSFTVDDRQIAERLIKAGVEGIITNDPRGMKSALQFHS